MIIISCVERRREICEVLSIAGQMPAKNNGNRNPALERREGK